MTKLMLISRCPLTNTHNLDIIMTNSWSFLFDNLNMDEQRDTSQDFWEDDGISLTGNPYAAPDTITVGGGLPGGMGDDHITFGAAQPVPYDSFFSVGEDHITFTGSHVKSGFGEDVTTFNLGMTTSNNPNRFKYSEERILKELTDYISATYNQHYSAGDDAVQTLDLIEACGDGESFCRSNILKYASRYDKKGTARRDIMKILHYAVLLMHFNDKNAQRETYPQ